jgi:hypothetical protein
MMMRVAREEAQRVGGPEKQKSHGSRAGRPAAPRATAEPLETAVRYDGNTLIALLPRSNRSNVSPHPGPSGRPSPSRGG